MPRTNKEQGREYDREWHREWRQTHKPEYLAIQRRYYGNHEDYRLRHNAAGRERNKQQKLLALSHYSDGTLKCAHCGIQDIDVLSLDHITGGGTRHRHQYGSKSYRWAIKENFPEGFQVLCFNCNWKKRLNQ